MQLNQLIVNASKCMNGYFTSNINEYECKFGRYVMNTVCTGTYILEMVQI